MSPKLERIILIHGAWAGAWVWEPLTKELNRRGWVCDAVELPGNGHHPMNACDVSEGDYMTTVRAAIERVADPVVLVGHSGGGMLVTAAAQACPDHVSHGVWIAGMLLPHGESFDDITEAIPGDVSCRGVSPHVQPTADGCASFVTERHAKYYFFHDLEASDAKTAAQRLTPQPNAGRRIKTHTGPRFAELPKLYIRTTQDRTVVPAAQDRMSASTANVTTMDLPCGHVPHITHAKKTAHLISEWIETTAKS